MEAQKTMLCGVKRRHSFQQQINQCDHGTNQTKPRLSKTVDRDNEREQNRYHTYYQYDSE
jgi:hypothetical protein